MVVIPTTFHPMRGASSKRAVTQTSFNIFYFNPAAAPTLVAEAD